MRYATAPVMIWHLAGQPHRPTLAVTDTPGVCAMCARQCERTAPAKKWLEGKSFTDPKHLRATSDRVCEACAWCCTGKGMDQIRMWTLLAREDKTLPASNPKAVFAADHLHFTSRADMRAVVDTLADPPPGEWAVCIAESGQKHTLPYARINRGAGRWRVRMDALDIDATPQDFQQVFAHVVALRAAGHSADAIEHLAPSFTALKTAADIAAWRHHARQLEPWRSSPLLHLAVFLPNKEHLDEYRTRYPAPGPDRPGDPLPVGAAGQRGRGGDRTGPLVGPGEDRAGDGGVLGDRLF
ncbi:hypothetical protein [Nocardiopsis lucentensis]|uniref:hypothetical protein n=1 Tax=Nocardiopsis lucentensis TaxID=53441 RepID=UPI000378D55A|nr:hypothetical protein [Nocardiopsis lucentensis]